MMQTIAVTGGSGKLGQYVVRELVRQSYKVVSLDQKHAAGLPCRQIIVDMNDLGQAASALQGADAVIHLAAVPSPTGFPVPTIFDNNVMGAYHILEAASMLGIRRVVMGSSTSCYGFAWAIKTSAAVFADRRGHPQLSQEGYGLSKTVGELTAAMFNRRNGIEVVNLRFSLIAAPEEYARLRRGMAKPEEFAKILWSYVDIRDAAGACVGIAAGGGGDGAVALNITGDDTVSEFETSELLRACYPDVTDLRTSFAGREPLFSNRLAKETLDWHPQYRWSDEAQV